MPQTRRGVRRVRWSSKQGNFGGRGTSEFVTGRRAAVPIRHSRATRNVAAFSALAAIMTAFPPSVHASTMKIASTLAVVVGFGGVALFTWLALKGTLSELGYLAAMGLAAAVSLAIHGFNRLQELDLRQLRVVLKEVKAVQQEVEETKAEIAAMYGGIEQLRREPLVLDDAKMAELRLGDKAIAFSPAVMRYTTGCIKRERERLAKVFVNQKRSDEVARGILDPSLDDQVFRWRGPEVPLDAPLVDKNSS